MILPIPDVRQKSSHDCGAAVVVAVLRYLGSRVAFAEIASALNCDPLDGTDARSIESLFRSRGLQCLSGNMSIPNVRHLVHEGCPVIAATRGHWVVIGGIQKKKVFYHDPINGPESRAFDDFCEWWRDQDRHGNLWNQFGIAAWK